MRNYLKGKTIFWDFDGVILDSMNIRDLGFEMILEEYPSEEVAELMKYHRANGGLSRYVKFRYFFETVRNEAVSDEQINELAARFSKVMLDSLCDTKLLIEDSLSYIKKHYRETPMNIVSGSDGNELKKICIALGIDHYFRAIHGSPTPKKQLVKDLLTSQKINSSDAVLIGDSINDLEAAQANNIGFLGYNNSSLLQLGDGYINQFSDLET